MSLTLDPVTVAPGTSVTVPVQNPNSVETIIISNKAYIDAVVTGIDNAGPRWLIAGTQDRFDASSGTFNGSVSIQGFNTANIPSTQVSVVLMTVYYAGDEIPNGSWPVSIPSQVVNNSVGIASSIKNDGNAAATQVVEATVTGSSGSNVVINNDGTETRSVLIAAALVQILKLAASDPVVALGAASHLVEVLGNLKVDGTLNVDSIISNSGRISLGESTQGDVFDTSGVHTYVKAATQFHVQVPSGSDVMTIDTGGITALNGVNFTNGRIKEISNISGTGNATVSHGLAGTPAAVIVCSAMAPPSTQTVNAASYTSSQVTISTGTSGAWKAICYR